MQHRGAWTLLLILVSGCDSFKNSGDVQVTIDPDQLSPLPRVVSSEFDGKPLRLVPDFYKAINASNTGPLVADVAAADTQGEGTLHFSTDARSPKIAMTLDTKAESVNVLEVRMRASAGDACQVSWVTDGSQASGLKNVRTASILSDGAFHTYEIPLTNPYDTTWSGTIRDVEFVPTDMPAEIDVASIRFLRKGPQAPRRVSSGGQTHEAFLGSGAPRWQFTVPPDAHFETHLGFSQINVRNPARMDATFRVHLRDENGKSALLAEKTFDPKTQRGFVPLHADLAAYAGQEVTLRFEVETWPRTLSEFAVWGSPMVTATPEMPPTPVILVSIDTLRADHLSCYGYERETTPFLDSFAKEAVLFENAVVQETYTLSSHMCMFTGLYPKDHRTTPNATLSEDAVTLTEVMRDAGYVTAAFTGFANWLKPDFGFAQGFDLYNVPDSDAPGVREGRRDVFTTHALAKEWLEAAERPGPFLFLHNFDVHGFADCSDGQLPYGPADPAYRHFSKEVPIPDSIRVLDPDYPESTNFFKAVYSRRRKVTTEEQKLLLALYDDSIRSVDAALEDFFTFLKEQGIYDDALIIVTADHGDAIGDPTPSGRANYGHEWVYDDCAKVPLIVKFPNGKHAGKRYTELVQTIDIPTTILDTLNVPAPESMYGRSLLGLLEDRADPNPFAYTRRGGGQSVRNMEWKLIRDTDDDEFEFFHLPSDPVETENIYAEKLPELEPIEEELHKFYDTATPGWHIKWNRPPGAKDAFLTISSPDPFTRVSFRRGDTHEWVSWRGDSPYIEQDARRIRIDLGRVPEETIRILGGSRTSPLEIKFTCGMDVDIGIGREEAQAVSEYQTPLKPDSPRLAGIPPEPLENGLTVWFVDVEDLTADGSPLTPEEQAELESLGYLN